MKRTQNHHEPLYPTDLIESMEMQGYHANTKADPYVGELGEDLSSALALLPEHLREKYERQVRSMIAIFANNDPTHVAAEVKNNGLVVVIRNTNQTNNNASSPE